MRVAFDMSGIVCPFNSQRGIGRYASQHLRALLTNHPEVEVLLLHAAPADVQICEAFSKGTNTTIVTYDNLDLDQVDILHLADPMTIIAGRRCLLDLAERVPTTVLFHDLIPLIRHTEHFDYWSFEFAAVYLRRLSIIKERVALTFTNSENTRADLMRIVGLSEHQTRAVFAGATLSAEASGQEIGGVGGPYFLVVGGLDAHKGFHHTFEAYCQLIAQGSPAHLVIVGSSNDPYKALYHEHATQLGVADRLHFTGFVSDEDLGVLYEKAVALIYPSQYEGFGFPVLEAMTRGCPVVTCRNSSLVEVGGDAVLYVEDLDLLSWMGRLMSDESLRSELKKLGLRQSQLFTWSRAAHSVVLGWQQILNPV